jgi:oligoendopeptidase F
MFTGRSGRSGARFSAVLCLCLLAQATSGLAPEAASPPAYHIDLPRYFFASPEAEVSERAKLFATISELEALKGQVTGSADNLFRALRLSDAVQMSFRRHMDYLRLRRALDTRDAASARGSAFLGSEVPERTAFLDREVSALTDSAFAQMLARHPALKAYSHAIETSRRYRSHVLPPGEEEVVRGLAPATMFWQYRLYQDLQDRTPAATILVGGRKLDVLKQRAAIADSPDRTVREAGFKKRYAGFTGQRDLYAFTLLHLASTGNRIAALRHYEDAAAEAYFRSEWQPAEVNAVLGQVKKHADLYKRYQRLRAEHVQRITGYADVNLWDLSMGRPGFTAPRFRFYEAAQAIREAVMPLGPDFSREMALLLDPANARLDVAPSINRYPGGFSLGFVGTPSVFFGGVFEGRYNDMRIMAHEATHAVHRQLMSNAQVLPPYASGPNYLFESFAVFSELLLADHLCRRQSDPLRREYFLEQFLEGKGTIMFVAGPEAELEQAIYAQEKQGRIKGAVALDALTRSIYSQYSIWPERHDELKGQWMMIPLMYEDPFYDINYVYAGLLALTYLDRYANSPKEFVPRYVALMKNGFDAPAKELLKSFLAIDIDQPGFVTGAMASVAERMRQLEQCYARPARD